MSVASQLTYMLALLAVGAGLRPVGILTERRRDRLTAVAFYIALPALVFSSTITRSLSDVLVWRLFVGVTVVLIAVAGIGWLVHRNHETPAQRGVAVVQSYHCNLGFLGVPFVAATSGGVTAGKASVVLGFLCHVYWPVQNGNSAARERELSAARSHTAKYLSAVLAALGLFSLVGVPSRSG